MNIFEDETYKNKYVLHIGDLLGNLLFTLRINNIDPKEIPMDLLEKYMCILAEKYTEDGIKAEFIITQEEVQSFIKDNKDLYKQSEDKNRTIQILKEVTAVDLAERHHWGMPFKLLNATVDGKVQSKVIEAYTGEKPKVLEKKTNN